MTEPTTTMHSTTSADRSFDRRAMLGGVAGAAAGLATGVGVVTAAQDATPAGMAGMATHPVVGTWEMSGQVGDFTFPFLATFHADGTYLERYAWGAVFVGVWKPTGARTAEGTVIAYEYINDRLTRGEGRFTAQVDESGKSIYTDGPFVNRFVDDGWIELAVEGPAPGTRLAVLPVVPLAELVPEGTPMSPAEVTREATPAP
jgi:hypothetical protein